MGVGLITMTAFPGVWSVHDYQKDFHPPIRKKAEPAEFGAWLQEQPESTKSILIPCKGDSRWGKVTRTYQKHVEDTAGLKKVKEKKQKYVVCLDPKSPFAGNVYNNDDKLEIYVKFVASLYYRPVHTAVYTLYNATLIHAAVIIIMGIVNDKPASDIGKKVVCSLADIVRTPVYGVAILIVTVAGILTAPFHPELVYDFRAVIARLNRELGWGEKEGAHDYMPCMQPKVNIMEYTLNDQPLLENKVYEDRSNPVLVALDNKLIGRIS